MKDTFYFQHDCMTMQDEKIKKLMREFGHEGYGIFWDIIETLYLNANALQTDYAGIAYDMRVDESKLKSVINDFNLFVIKDGFFGSKSVERRLNERYEKSNKAKMAANSRWSNQPFDADELQAQCERIDSECDSNAIKVKESKIDESKRKKGKYNKENLPTNLFCDESLDSGKDEELKNEFDKFRKKYPGAGKLGIETEWDYFKKKYKDYKEIVPILNNAIDILIIRHDMKYKMTNFNQQWKNFRTWINNRCWEEAIESSESDIQANKIISNTNKHEEIINGKRTYMRGENRVILPDDAPPRPGNCYTYSESLKEWKYQMP